MSARYAAVALTLAASAVVGCPADGAGPEQIHLGWRGSTATTMTVTWRSASREGQVRYGATSRYGEVQRSSATPFEGSYLHHAELRGLGPGSRYHYSCGRPGAWSADRIFRTAPRPGAPLRFVVLGDTRGVGRRRRQVRDAILRRTPQLLLHTGDLVTRGGVQREWDAMLREWQPLLATTPLMPAIGNHEQNSPRYFAQLALPPHAPAARGYADQAYYAFDCGGVHFVSLSTEPVGKEGGAQQRWLERDLAAASKRARWIVVYAHRPPYSSGLHGGSRAVQRAWVPLFERYRVAITFWGHDHSYERTRPLLRGKAVTAAKGVTYVVTGGGGGSLYKVGRSAFTAAAMKVHHFVEVEVEGERMTVTARGVRGEALDRAVLRAR